MKLTSFAQFYYSDIWDENSLALYSIITNEHKRAQEHFPIIFRNIMSKNRFHDWYLTRIAADGNGIVDGVAMNALCIDIEKDAEKYCLVFLGLDDVRVHGALYSIQSNFPPPSNSILPLAQILDVWFAFDTMLECTILLEDGRFIEIRFRSCEFIDCKRKTCN